MNEVDPVHEENGQWFFWDETQASRYGPYADRAKASEEFERYCTALENGLPCQAFTGDSGVLS